MGARLRRACTPLCSDLSMIPALRRRLHIERVLRELRDCLHRNDVVPAAQTDAVGYGAHAIAALLGSWRRRGQMIHDARPHPQHNECDSSCRNSRSPIILLATETLDERPSADLRPPHDDALARERFTEHSLGQGFHANLGGCRHTHTLHGGK